MTIALKSTVTSYDNPIVKTYNSPIRTRLTPEHPKRWALRATKNPDTKQKTTARRPPWPERRENGPQRSGPERAGYRAATHLPSPSRLGAIGSFDPCNHFGPPEVDGAAAAQRRGVLDEDDLFVVAQAMKDLFRLDQAAGDLLAAGGLMGGAGIVLPARGGAGTFGDRIAQRGEFAAGLGQILGGLIVLDMGEEPQIGGIEPGLPAVGAPALGELAERLVDQAEIDAVLAAGIASSLENPHVAEAGDLIEQK